MRYHLTYPILLRFFFLRTLPLFLVAYLVMFVSFFVIFFLLDGGRIQNIREAFLSLQISDAVGIIGTFVVYIAFYLVFYLLKAKKRLIGKHTLKIEEENFVWKGNGQEVRTSFKKIRKLIITKEYFSLKFDGIRKAKIYKSWSLEGFDDFSKQLEAKAQEFKAQIIKK